MSAAMSLSPGHKLAHYEIVAPIGKGGMGEVYRARDSKLGRNVAIKVLPEEFSRDQERLQRFEREARLLAQLNHTNIATLYGLEDSDSQRFLVMELVEGETLAERIARGPIPLDEAIPLFVQIAEGLEAAHEKGIVHRDLKPANIKIGPDGKIKILDFGLAKAFAPGADVSAGTSQSPTLTKGTALGAILGTAPYMSPEQARGKSVDRRTDVWAFGCCLYEALSGKSVFFGETVSDTIAAILEKAPDWSALPVSTPWRVREVLRRCLKKNAHERLHAAADARLELNDALGEPSTHAPTAPGSQTRAGLWAFVAAGLGIIAVAAALWFTGGESLPQSVTRFAIQLPPGETVALNNRADLAVSPDGSLVVYVGRTLDGTTRLYAREIGAFEPEPIAGTEGGVGPFFSPDGEWLGFFADGQLKKRLVSGGPAITLCEAPVGRGATWGPDDTIVFTARQGGALSMVSAAGGAPQVLTIADAPTERFHYWPEFLPGGKTVLFTAGGDKRYIEAVSLETGERRVLLEGASNAHYVPTGHLLYTPASRVGAGSLLAVPFDLDELHVTGAPVPVLDGVRVYQFGAMHVALGKDGTLAYIPGEGVIEEKRTLVWVDRDGAATPVDSAPRAFHRPRIAPDGQRIAVEFRGRPSHLWIYSDGTRRWRRLTYERGGNQTPVWAPDGKRLAFRSIRDGAYNVYSSSDDGTGAVERLTESPNWQFPSSWSPDGRVLAYTELNATTDWDIWVLPLDGERKPRALLQTEAYEADPMISPDGAWIAYTSDETGQNEVYIQAFPGPGRKQQVSSDGGSAPRFRGDGRELFYRNGNKVMFVRIESGADSLVSTPRLLFEGTYVPDDYDVSPDGERFVMVESDPETAPTRIHVILNWFEELERLVPTN